MVHLPRKGVLCKRPFTRKVNYLVSFLVFGRKELCEARVNFEACSYLADIPTLADGPPTIEHGSLEDHYTK